MAVDRPRILIVTEEGGIDNPSGYVRAGIYEPLFRAAGIPATFASRQDPKLQRFLKTRHPVWSRLRSVGLGRLTLAASRRAIHRNETAIAAQAREHDVIYLQKTNSFPLYETLRALPGKRLIYDLNDALWTPRYTHFLQGRLTDVLKGVDAVVCDNPYGADYARRHNPSVYVTPDPPQLEIFDAARAGRTNGGAATPLPPRERPGEGPGEGNASGRPAPPSRPITIGWLGSPATAHHLFLAWEALERVCAGRNDVVLRLVGAGDDPSLYPHFENVPVSILPRYNQQQMVREVLDMDIGLFPLYDVEEGRARGVLKATVYMSGEAAVIASPVGQSTQLIRHGDNGLLAGNTEAWVNSLHSLLDDHPRRRAIAAAGLACVRADFTLQRCFQQLLTALLGSPSTETAIPQTDRRP